MSWNDVEITPRGNARFRYEMLKDDCKFKTNEWAKTVVQYATDKPNRLPVVDVAVRDTGDEGQEFWVDIGSACFY